MSASTVEAARAAVADKLSDLHSARAAAQRAEANLLRARAAWLDCEVERAAAQQRVEEAGAAALRASEALTRASFCSVPGGVS